MAGILPNVLPQVAQFVSQLFRTPDVARAAATAPLSVQSGLKTVATFDAKVLAMASPIQTTMLPTIHAKSKSHHTKHHSSKAQ